MSLKHLYLQSFIKLTVHTHCPQSPWASESPGQFVPKMEAGPLLPLLNQKVWGWSRGTGLFKSFPGVIPLQPLGRPTLGSMSTLHQKHLGKYNKEHTGIRIRGSWTSHTHVLPGRLGKSSLWTLVPPPLRARPSSTLSALEPFCLSPALPLFPSPPPRTPSAPDASASSLHSHCNQSRCCGSLCPLSWSVN